MKKQPKWLFLNGDRRILRRATKKRNGSAAQNSRTTPRASTNKKGTFVYQKFLFCLSKPQAWHIIAARSAVHIISPFGAVSHHAPACILPAA